MGSNRFLALVAMASCTLSATACNQRNAVGLEASQATKPAIALTSPQSGQMFAPGDVIVMEARVTGSSRKIAKVRFLSNGELVGVATRSPYRISYRTGRHGQFLLRAAAMMDDGTVLESEPAYVSVPASSQAGHELSADDLAAIQIGEDAVDVRLVSPKPQAEYHAPATIPIQAAALSTADPITRLEVLGDGLVLVTLTSPPYEFVWKGMPVGKHSITARVTTESGRTTMSSSVPVVVKK